MSQGRLIDADTLDIPGVGPVRLAGIDAPENGQPARNARGREFDAGQAATEAFAAYLRRRQREGWRINIEDAGKGADRYGRTIGRVILTNGRKREDACQWLVRNGFAVAEYGPPDYSSDERRAKRERAGLWAGEWQRPKDWRSARKGMAIPAPGAVRRARPTGAGWLGAFRTLARLARILRRL